jgi:outer membrane protein assembly factor BamB
VAGELLFVGGRDSQVYCINISTGMPVWKRLLWGEVWSSPAVDTERVYVGVDDGNVYALNISNGGTVWKTSIGPGAVRSSPALVDGKIYIGSGTSGLYCLNALTGDIIWVAPTELQIYSSPAVSDGVVYFGGEDYDLHAVNASTGVELWHNRTGSVQSSPSVYDGKVYVGSVYGFVYCLNASDGKLVWRYQTEGQVDSSPAVAYGYVYIGSHSGSLYCFNASTGELVWESPTDYWIISSPSVADGNVYIGSEDNGIYCFDAFTGQQKWRYETYNLVESSPAIVNNTLYIGSDDYIIYAFALTNSATGNMPFQENNNKNVNGSTVAFDAIAVSVLAAISLAFVLVFRRNQKTLKTQTATTPNYKSWFKVHADMVCILVILVFSVSFFVFLGNEPLWQADEQTYSQWAFYMNKSGDYLVPCAYGHTNFWIAKPPLYMWLMALSYQLFGYSNFSTRLISPIFAVLTLIIVYYLGKMLFNRKTGLASSLVLGTFETFFIFAKHAMTDVMFVFFIVTSIYFMLVSDKGKKVNQYALLSGVFFGLALLTKQIQAFLLPLIIVIYFLVTKKSLRFLFTKRFALFIGVGLLIFLPWIILMQVSYGQIFSEWYFMYSGIVRATSPIEGHNEETFYYFTYLLTEENPVWAAVLPLGFGLSTYAAIKNRSKPDKLLIVWIVTVLGLFTFAQTKIYWYILPAFPAFALTIGNLLVQLSIKVQQKRKRKTAG